MEAWMDRYLTYDGHARKSRNYWKYFLNKNQDILEYFKNDKPENQKNYAVRGNYDLIIKRVQQLYSIHYNKVNKFDGRYLSTPQN